MDHIKITEQARALLNAHGDKAEAEAAEKARLCDDKGKTEDAENWRQIRVAINHLRSGPVS